MLSPSQASRLLLSVTTRLASFFGRDFFHRLARSGPRALQQSAQPTLSALRTARPLAAARLP
jgi:hypothetical protein